MSFLMTIKKGRYLIYIELALSPLQEVIILLLAASCGGESYLRCYCLGDGIGRQGLLVRLCSDRLSSKAVHVS